MNPIPSWQPDLSKKWDIDAARANRFRRINPITGEQEDPLGWLGNIRRCAEPLRHPTNWLSFIGVVGIIIAFGHSILAMSGEETLAQVYREVESPKLPNFKKAAFIVFHLQPAAHRHVQFLGRAVDSRRPADENITRQLDGRPGDAHGRTRVAAAVAECALSCSSAF